MVNKKRRRKKKRLKKMPVIILLIIILATLLLIFNSHIGNDTQDIVTSKANAANKSTDHYFSTNMQLYAGYDLTEYNIESAPTEISTYKRVKLQDNQLANGNLILVNANNLLADPPDTEDLVQISTNKDDSYLVKDNTIYLASNALESLNRFLADAYALEGINDIIVWSGYRSLTEQKVLYNANTGAKNTETNDTAAPGASEHHTGFAIDLGIYQNTDGKTSADFLTDPKYSWISKNAYKYGFIQRYSADKASITGIVGETWHYRYVGLPHSIVMTEKNMCLEEYLDFLKTCTYNGNHLHIKLSDTLNYEVYYIKPTGIFKNTIYVPKNYQYQISGDNKNGYIVTVNLNNKIDL